MKVAATFLAIFAAVTCTIAALSQPQEHTATHPSDIVVQADGKVELPAESVPVSNF